MAVDQKCTVIDPVDRRIFSDQAFYDEEMEKIFGRAGLVIGHESLVPASDDFFHTDGASPGRPDPRHAG